MYNTHQRQSYGKANFVFDGISNITKYVAKLSVLKMHEI